MASDETITKQGPYVDIVRYEFIQNQEDAITALQDGQVEVIADPIEPQLLEELESYSNIEIAQTRRNGYGFFLFNYEKYPLNMTVLRRAAAFAFDKEKVANETWSGYAQPIDSPVPPMNPFSAEQDLDYHYYEAEIDYANSLLDNASFEVDSTTGFRKAPNEESFDICIQCSSESQTELAVARVLQGAFEDLKIEAAVAPIDRYELECRTTNFDVRLVENRFGDFSVEWLAFRLWVGGSRCYSRMYTPFQEILKLRNATFRHWKNQLLDARSFEKVHEAAVEIQKILVYESPMIIAYNNKYLSAYRINRFEEFIKGMKSGVDTWWMPYRAQLIDSGGDTGGVLPIAYPHDLSSFNFMVVEYPETNQIFQLFYNSLIEQGPHGEDINWFAKDYTIETDEDDPIIPESFFI